MKRDRNYLINFYNATSTDDGHGRIETYPDWLERQLLSRIEKIEELEKAILPPAEGAEETLIYHNLTQPFRQILQSVALHGYDIVFAERDCVKCATEFATLHAQRLAEKMVEEKNDLQKLMNDISEWSDETFGSGQRNPAIVYHLKKEVDELIAAIEKTNTLGGDPSVGVGEFGRQRTVTMVEYADCLMLLLDSSHHFGISAKELLSVTRVKLEINKVRKWGKPDENGVVEHIE